jgi:hypothetical protein
MQAKERKDLLTSLAMLPTDLGYAILIKLLMAYVAEVLTCRVVMTPETYNVKEMSEILFNIGESIKTGNSISTEETRQFVQQLASKIDRTKLIDEFIKVASECGH